MPWQIPVTSFRFSSLPTPRQGKLDAQGPRAWPPLLLSYKRSFLCSVSCLALLYSLTSSSPTGLILLDKHTSHFSKPKGTIVQTSTQALKSPLTDAQCTQSYFFHSRKKWLFTVETHPTWSTCTQVSLLPHFISAENWNPTHSLKAISNATSFLKLCHHPPNRQDFS